jgi:uncharacterized protein (TIGR02996 family)
MTPRDALLEAVRAAPDDDVPRLVLADWLIDHGEPERGEFIQVQCALARLSEDDPKRPALKAREMGLLLKHETAWAQPLPELARAWTFRRGFLDEAIIEPRRVDAGPLATVLSTDLVRRLTLAAAPPRPDEEVHHDTGLDDRAIGALLDVVRVRPLLALNLFGGGGDVSGALRSLCEAPGLTGLTALNLGYCQVDPEGLRILSGSSLMNSLTDLDLSGNGLTEDEVAVLAASPRLANLRRLSLAYTPFAAAALWALLSAPALANLDFLDLTSCNPGQAPEQPLPSAVSDAAPPLHLRLNGNRGMDLGRLVSQLRRVRRLDLGTSGLVDAAVRNLADEPALARLQSLDLSGNHFGAVGVAALVRSPHFSNVQALDLSSNWLGDAVAETIAAAPGSASLRALHLTNTHLTERGVAALARSPYLSGLRCLSLRDNRLPPAAARSLARSPYLTGLTSLNLSLNRIGPDGARWLAGTPHLSNPAVVNVADNGLGREGRAVLLEAATQHLDRVCTFAGPV